MKNFQAVKAAPCFARVLAIAALTASVVFAQAVSQISGSARDTSGAVVPNVEITATAPLRGLALQARDERGIRVGEFPLTAEDQVYCLQYQCPGDK